jgi:hypothetical protein
MAEGGRVVETSQWQDRPGRRTATSKQEGGKPVLRKPWTLAPRARLRK